MENRKRNVHLHVMVTPDELAAIHERMTEAGISNAGAYVRKMALNGYILHIDLTPVKELISLSWWQSKTRAAGSDVGTCRLVLFTIYIYVSENVIPEVQPLYK